MDVAGVPGLGDLSRASHATARPSHDNSALTPRERGGLEEGDLVWIACTRQGFRRATIISVDPQSDAVFVEAARDDADPMAGGQFQVRRSDVRPFFDAGAGKTFADNTEMVHLDDANILDNMRKRFQQDKIYTYTANVLLAVNPYKQLQGLYSADRIAEYRGKNPGALAPHPYTIADTAYRHLLRDRTDQALIISGESGAGKTETAKVTMHYLTQVSRTDAGHGSRIQDKIINANPILESFGNASTVRNQNSSRFGKYNEMCFNPVGSLMCAGIKTYLLECSRVVHQQAGERNFHVFYELLHGMDADGLDGLMLDPTHPYTLLYENGASPYREGSVEAKKEAGKFASLRKALGTFVTGEVQQEFWEVVAALIHLGEVGFAQLEGGFNIDPANGSAPTPTPKTPKTPYTAASPSPSPAWSPTSCAEGSTHQGSEEAQVEISEESADALAQAADLLGLLETRLEYVLKFKEVQVKKGGETQTIACPRSKQQAFQTLQSIIKILYKRLFDTIVDKINASSAVQGGNQGQANYNSIGTLDIYGFERLRTNSFEQLCINLANERLQQFFIEEVLEAEQRVYSDEGLNVCQWQLPDNTAVVKGIQAVMGILDEHSLRSMKNLSRAGGDKDTKFCEHVHREKISDHRASASGPIMALKMNGALSKAGHGVGLLDGFQIRHYAGEVAYSTKGWIDKNNDALVPQVEALLADATKGLTQSLADKSGVHAINTNNSVGQKYLNNLNHLMGTLKKCSVHYIRCFNPNNDKQAGVFDRKYVLDQVIQCGTVDLVRIMHEGFPNRIMLKDLRERFEGLLPEDFARYSDRDFIHAIMLAFELDTSQWTIGTRRLFLKAGQLRVLEHLRDLGSQASQEVILKIRMIFARKKFKNAVSIVKIMNWWPAHVRKQRRMGLIGQLQKAVFIFVRLQRWLQAARLSLYGKPQTPPALPEAETPLLFRGQEAEGAWAPKSQVFVALNSYEEPHYTAYLQSNMHMQNKVADDILKMWQRNTTETILYHDGRQVLSARFSPHTFLEPSAAAGPQAGGQSGRTLDDVRRVDCHETGQAFLLAEAAQWEDQILDITCMCQHKKEQQLFASCDADNQIAVWKWLGTEQSDPTKPATKILGGLCLPKSETVLQMCFLSSDVLPRRIIDKLGTVLVILTSEPKRDWLVLQLITVYGGNHYVESMQRVDVPADVAEQFRQPRSDQISFLTTSFSERILSIGGQGLLQFWEVTESSTGLIVLELIEDMAQTFTDMKHSPMVSCLCLPPPIKGGVYGKAGMLDWIIVGDSIGKIYGFRFDAKEGRGVEHNAQASGRFRGNEHTPAVPIRGLIGTYGGASDAHHKQVQARGLSYSLFLNKAPLDAKGFCSLGDDGKLLAWQLKNPNGWCKADEAHVGKELAGGSQVKACHSSRLVPNIVLMADASRRAFLCHDRTNPNAAMTEATMCSYV